MRLWTELYGLNTASRSELYCTGWVMRQVTSWIYRLDVTSVEELDCTGCVLHQVTNWIVQSGYCAK